MQAVGGLVVLVVCWWLSSRRPQTSLVFGSDQAYYWYMTQKHVSLATADLMGNEPCTSPITWNFLIMVHQTTFDRFQQVIAQAANPDAFRDAMLQRVFEDAQLWAGENFARIVEETPLTKLAGWTASEAQ